MVWGTMDWNDIPKRTARPGEKTKKMSKSARERGGGPETLAAAPFNHRPE